MSKFYTFLKGIMATMLLLLAPNMALAQGAESLGAHIKSLDELSSDKTYMIYNETYTAYAVYDATNSTTNVWAANMTGHGANSLKNKVAELDVKSKAQSWLVSYEGEKLYIKNRETGKYLSPGRGNNFKDDPVALTVVDLGDGKFAFTPSSDKDFFCASPQLEGTPIAVWTSNDPGSSWEFIENPNVPATDGPALPEALAGNYTAKIGSYTSSNAQLFAPADGKKSYKVTMTVNDKGEVLLKGLIGRLACNFFNNETDQFESIDSCFVGTYDAASSTVQFHYPQPVGGNPFTITDLETYDRWVPTTSSFTASLGYSANGSVVLSVNSPIEFQINEETKVAMNDVRFRAEGAESEVVNAPMEMAGKYNVTLGEGKFASEKVELTMANTFKAKVTVSEDGRVGMKGLIGTPCQREYDEMEGNVSVDSCYVGTYDDEAQTITFTQPADYFIYDMLDNRYMLKNPLVLHVQQNADGTYTLSTEDDVVFDAVIMDEAGDEMETTLTYAGATFKGVKPVSIAKANLVGKWNLTYKTLDMETGSAIDADAPTSFEIVENNGELFFKGLADGTHEWPITYMTDGIEIATGVSEDNGEVLVSDLYGMSLDPVKFSFASANSMDLESMLVTSTNNGMTALYALSGTAVKEKSPEKFDPAPAEMAGRYLIQAGEYVATGEYNDTNLPVQMKGVVNVGEDGKVMMTGFIGTPCEGTNGDDFNPYVTATYVGAYNAAENTVTFSVPEGYSILHEDSEGNSYYWTLAEPFTLQVEKDDKGHYMMSTIDAITFDLVDDNKEIYIMTVNGVAMIQQDVVNFTDEDLLGSWKMEVPEVNPENGVPTGKMTDFTFDITKDEATGEYGMTNAAGGTYVFSVSRVLGGISVKGTFEFVDGHNVLLASSAEGSIDNVEFDFKEDKTMVLATGLYLANENVVGLSVEEGTVAKKNVVEPKGVEILPAPGHYATLPSHIVLRTNGKNISQTMGVMASYTTETSKGVLTFGLDKNIDVVADSIVFDIPEKDLKGQTTLEVQIMSFDEDGAHVSYEGESFVKVSYTADEVEDPSLPLGNAVTSLDDLDPNKTYVLYNPVDKVYAVSNPEQAVNIWAANVPGEAAFNGTSIDFDATSAHSSWMVVKKGDKIAIYNMGAKKYLTTPCMTGDGGAPSVFTDELTYLVTEDLGDGKFAFSATGNQYDWFCAAKQNAASPMANWSTDDHGSCWMFVENPNVAADAEIAATITGFETVDNAPVAQGIYTIHGVKLNVTDVRKLQKGLYIVNGKKVLVK